MADRTSGAGLKHPLASLLRSLALAVLVISRRRRRRHSGQAAHQGPLGAGVPVATWGGFYVGVGVGFRADEADTHVTSTTFSQVGFPVLNLLTGCGDLPCTTGEPVRGPAFRVAPYAGFNWQVAPQWVVGAEADYGFARHTATLNAMFYPSGLSGVATDSFEVKTRWDASARLRAGYLLAPNFLLYATGGAAWMRLETTSNCAVTPAAFGILLSSCANFFPLLGTNGLSPGPIGHSTTSDRLDRRRRHGSRAVVELDPARGIPLPDYGTFGVSDTRNCAAP